MKSKKSRLNNNFPFINRDIEKFFFDNGLEEFRKLLNDINNSIREDKLIKTKAFQKEKTNSSI